MKANKALILLTTLALLFAAPADTAAQGFLKKMKQKAEKAMSKVVGVDTEANEENNRRNDEQDDETDNSSNNPLANQPSATDKLPKLKQSSVVWDGEVTPSTATDARALLGELPALPSADQIANPVQATVDAYHRQLSALNMRAEELDEEQACSDEEMLAARDKLYDEIADVLGISAADMKRLEDPNISDAEREALEQKMVMAATGGMGNMEDGMGDALMGDLQGMQARNAQYQARLEELGKEAEALEKKGNNLTPAERKRAQEITAESQAIQQKIMGGGLNMGAMGNIMQMGKKADALSNRIRKEMTGDEKASKAFTQKLQANAKKEEGVVKSCEQIARDYEDNLLGIYTQIWEEDDATKIHALYDEADNLMKNYRQRAAKVYLKGLQLRLDNTKALMPDAEKIYSGMADDGLIPKCAMGRAPLNVVIQCIDILNEAYVDFPQPDVLCCKKSVIDFGLKPGEVLHNTESGYSGAMGAAGMGGMGSGGSGGAAGDTLALERDFLAKSRFLVYNEKEQAFYKLENGNRTRLADDQTYDYSPAVERDDSYYGELSLRGGNRKVSLSRSGTLTLHDGTTFQPVAMHRTGNWMVFIAWDYRTDCFARYMYKL